MRTVLVFALFTACVGFSCWLTVQSWNGAVYVYVGERRAPASVRTVHDYSAIDRRALYRSVHAQLVSSAQLLRRDGNMGVRLGHPLVPREQGGGREFACQIAGHTGVFDRLEMTFYGTGITVAGDPPLITVDTPCQASGQLDTLDTVWIPMDAIIATGPRDQNLETDGEHPMLIRLQNIPGEWPENWVLYSVRFYNSETEESGLMIDAARLKQADSQMLSFDWKVKR